MSGPVVRPDRVAIYIRWSTDDQASGTTLEVQREACLHFVRSQGWEARDELILVDDGCSGATLDRPGMARLRDLVRQGAVDCVVVLKVDRLSRNIVDAVHLVLREWEGRCHLKSVREPIDTATDLGRMIFGLLAMFADFERAAIRDRTQGGKVRRIREGQQMHARPAFGYAASPEARGRWVEEAAEASLVRRIFSQAADGEPAARIARRLNADGLRTRAGREWGSRAVLWILRNRTYVGEVVYGRTSLRLAPEPPADGPTAAVPGAGLAAAGSRGPGQPRRIRVRRPEPLVHAPTQAAPALVEPTCFQRVQERLESAARVRHRAGARAGASPHALVGLARCRCGAAMVFKQGRRAAAGGYYVCARSRTGSCRAGGHVPAGAVEAAVESLLLALLDAGGLPAHTFAARLAGLAEEARSLHLAATAARRAAARLDADEERLLQRVRAGEIPLGQLTELRAAIGREREALAQQLAALEHGRRRAERRGRAARQTLAVQGAAAIFRSGVGSADRRRVLGAALAMPVVLWRQPRGAGVELSVTWAIG